MPGSDITAVADPVVLFRLVVQGSTHCTGVSADFFISPPGGSTAVTHITHYINSTFLHTRLDALSKSALLHAA